MGKYESTAYAEMCVGISSEYPNSNVIKSETLEAYSFSETGESDYWALIKFSVKEEDKIKAFDNTEDTYVHIYVDYYQKMDQGITYEQYICPIHGEVTENSTYANTDIYYNYYAVLEDYLSYPYKGWIVLKNGIDQWTHGEEAVKNGIAAFYFPKIYGGKMRIYTSTSSYKPYINFYVKDIEPTARFKNFPAYINPREQTEMNFSVGFSDKPIERYPYVQKTVYSWSTTDGESGEFTLNYPEADTERKFIVPANTYPIGKTVTATITVTLEGDTTNSETKTFSTTDSVPNPPYDLLPDNEYVDGSSEIIFSWKRSISTGTEQTKYEIEYSTNSGTSWTPLKSEDTKNTFATIPAGTLTAGKMSWRVKTYNADGVPSDWSTPANIIVQAAPKQPSIVGITNNARPQISWQSDGQVSFKLQIIKDGNVIFDTGEKAGGQNSYKTTEFLEDGVYIARLYTKNSFNLWSEPAEQSFTILTEKPDKPVISGMAIENGAAISFSNGAYQNYLLRDGEPIYKFKDSETTRNDYTGVGPHTYKIRAVNIEGNFSDSDELVIETKVRYATIATAENPEYMITLKLTREKPFSMSSSIAVQHGKAFYAGRKYPVYSVSEYEEHQHSREFSFLNKSDFDKLMNLISRKKTIIYRDSTGEKIPCVLVSVNYNVDHISRDFSISMENVDIVERIMYD